MVLKGAAVGEAGSHKEVFLVCRTHTAQRTHRHLPPAPKESVRLVSSLLAPIIKRGTELLQSLFLGLGHTGALSHTWVALVAQAHSPVMWVHPPHPRAGAGSSVRTVWKQGRGGPLMVTSAVSCIPFVLLLA